MLRAAVEQFIDKDRKDIEGVAMETLEGHQRWAVQIRIWMDFLGICRIVALLPVIPLGIMSNW
jgi:hypothetical protein